MIDLFKLLCGWLVGLFRPHVGCDAETIRRLATDGGKLISPVALPGQLTERWLHSRLTINHLLQHTRRAFIKVHNLRMRARAI